MVFCSWLLNRPSKTEDTYFISALSTGFPLCSSLVTVTEKKGQGVTKVLTRFIHLPQVVSHKSQLNRPLLTIVGWAYFGLQPLGQMQLGKMAIMLRFPNFPVCGLGLGHPYPCGSGLALQPPSSRVKPKPPTCVKLTRQK